MIGSQKVQAGLLAPRKEKSVIFSFLTGITVISPKSVRDFGSTENEKCDFRFPHGSMT